LERTLQPILLSDSNKTRGTLRWELLRGRGLEPVIDTIENQKAYAAVIHYHQMRLLAGINQLQENVREALGLPVRARSNDEKEFDEHIFEQARADAEVVQANIKTQFEKLMSEHRREAARNEAATSSTSVPSSTRTATSAITEMPSSSTRTDVDVRNRVWNALHIEIFEDDQDEMHPERSGSLTRLFLREIWKDVLARPIDEIPNDFEIAWSEFRQVLMSCTETVFYAIVEHAGQSRDIREKLDSALERSRAPYRFVGAKLLPTNTR
jgi:hypothetical protein